MFKYFILTVVTALSCNERLKLLLSGKKKNSKLTPSLTKFQSVMRSELVFLKAIAVIFVLYSFYKISLSCRCENIGFSMYYKPSFFSISLNISEKESNLHSESYQAEVNIGWKSLIWSVGVSVWIIKLWLDYVKCASTCSSLPCSMFSMCPPSSPYSSCSQ